LTVTNFQVPSVVATLPWVTRQDGKPSLLCVSLMLPKGGEVDLITMQLNHSIGIFACDTATVYSNEAIPISVGGKSILTGVIEGSLKCRFGGAYGMALNTHIFINLWKKVFEDRQFEQHDWTAKVDPDAVFIPSRLRKRRAKEEQYRGTFLNNCKIGLHGPLEVISRAGMLTFKAGLALCVEANVADPYVYGEDVFLRRCLRYLGVQKTDDFGLLSEIDCFENPGDCTNGKVSFHPFKDVYSYLECQRHSEMEPYCRVLGCVPFDPVLPCQCNSECAGYSSCCADYSTTCEAKEESLRALTATSAR
jgi:hypothetical protein